MRTPLECLVDTNLFNRILDGVIAIEALTGDVVTHATHVQLDEINKGSVSAKRFAF